MVTSRMPRTMVDTPNWAIHQTMEPTGETIATNRAVADGTQAGRVAHRRATLPMNGGGAGRSERQPGGPESAGQSRDATSTAGRLPRRTSDAARAVARSGGIIRPLHAAGTGAAATTTVAARSATAATAAGETAAAIEGGSDNQAEGENEELVHGGIPSGDGSGSTRSTSPQGMGARGGKGGGEIRHPRKTNKTDCCDLNLFVRNAAKVTNCRETVGRTGAGRMEGGSGNR